MAKTDIGVALGSLIDRQKLHSFRLEYQATATDEEALGIMVSQFFEWDGAAIMRTLAEALEDANFHSEVEKLRETFPELLT